MVNFKTVVLFLKITLLVQRSPLALIDYYNVLSSIFFMRGKQNISCLHKIICSLVSFLLLIMKVVAACKVPSQCNVISPSFL